MIFYTAGATFTSPVGPIGIFYLTLGFSTLLLLHFIFMNLCSRFKKKDQNVTSSETEKQDFIME